MEVNRMSRMRKHLPLPTRRPPSVGGPPYRKLPARVKPLMWAHYALSRDKRAQRMWRKRVEDILQAEAIDTAPTEREKQLLARRPVWRHVRKIGKRGTTLGLLLSSLWMLWLIPTYAFGHGFGWAALLYLLPVPIAMRLGRQLWEAAALEGMRHYGETPTPAERAASLVRAAMGSFGAGFGFAFNLVFLQGLISWFMTPAPTLGIEIGLDIMMGLTAGILCGSVSMAMAPMVAPSIPASKVPYLRLEEAQRAALLTE